MKGKILRVVLLVVVIASVAAMLFGFAGERRATVGAEPLECFEQGDRLVCLDGPVTDDMRCEQLDPSTVLCSG